MKTPLTDHQIRQYLLGNLPEAEQSALELALLADHDQFNEAWEVENSLIDGYVRNTLPPAERALFESHYLASPLHRERTAVAELLLQNIDQTPARHESGAAVASHAWWREWLNSLRGPQLAFAMGLSLALLLATSGVFWLWRERTALHNQVAELRTRTQREAQAVQQREQAANAQNNEQNKVQKLALEKEIAGQRERNRQLSAELDKLRQTESAAPSELLSFLLTPAPTRGQNETAPPTIPRVKRCVQLLMDLTGNRYSAYQAKLQTVEGRELFSRPVRPTQDRAFAQLVLPASMLKPGDYILILSGLTPRGAEEFERYFFRVQ